MDVAGEIDVYTAPPLRELLIDLVNKKNYQLVVNMDEVEFLDSTGLGVLVGAVKRVRAHDKVCAIPGCPAANRGHLVPRAGSAALAGAVRGRRRVRVVIDLGKAGCAGAGRALVQT